MSKSQRSCKCSCFLKKVFIHPLMWKENFKTADIRRRRNELILVEIEQLMQPKRPSGKASGPMVNMSLPQTFPDKSIVSSCGIIVNSSRSILVIRLPSTFKFRSDLTNSNSVAFNIVSWLFPSCKSWRLFRLKKLDRYRWVILFEFKFKFLSPGAVPNSKRECIAIWLWDKSTTAKRGTPKNKSLSINLILLLFT